MLANAQVQGGRERERESILVIVIIVCNISSSRIQALVQDKVFNNVLLVMLIKTNIETMNRKAGARTLEIFLHGVLDFLSSYKQNRANTLIQQDRLMDLDPIRNKHPP